MSDGINRLARVLDNRMKYHDDKPPVLDIGTILDDMSLLTNKFPEPIPYTDYMICRSVSYDPQLPLTMTWWFDEGWNKQAGVSDWESAGGNNQPQHWTRGGQPAAHKGRWGELVDPYSGETYWKEKHQTPDGDNHMHGPKGQHDHDEDSVHYHDIYLPRKMYRIQPGDRVLVAWAGDDACVVDVVMAATEMM